MPNINWLQPPGRDEFSRQEHLGTPGQSSGFQPRRSFNPISRAEAEQIIIRQLLGVEHEAAKDPIKVRLAQNFTPFILNLAKISSINYKGHKNISSISRSVTLQLNHTLKNGQDLPELFFSFNASPHWADKAAGLTPFNWELGFPMEAGYDPEKQDQVTKEMQGLKIDFAQAPLYFKAILDEQPQYDVLRHKENPHSFNPEAVEFFRLLRLNVSFGTGRTLAAKPNPFLLNLGFLDFDLFFDADRGAFTIQDELNKDGLPVYVPPITALEEISPEEQIKHPERKPHPLIENIRGTFVHLKEPPPDERW